MRALVDTMTRVKLGRLLTRLHDSITADRVLFAALGLTLVVALLVVATRPKGRTLLAGMVLGLALLVLSFAVSSTAPSGDASRTRTGFPHWVWMDDHYAATSTSVVTMHPRYLVVDVIFWESLAVGLVVLANAFTSRARGAPDAPR